MRIITLSFVKLKGSELNETLFIFDTQSEEEHEGLPLQVRDF